MDRKLLTSPIYEAGITELPCPTCSSGHLTVKKNTFEFEDSRKSRERQVNHSPSWGPEQLEYLFCCLLVCSNTSCKEVVSCTGVGCVAEEHTYDHEGNPDVDIVDSFYPKYFQPPLELFKVPRGTPANVVSEMNTSFALFYADPPSAANHVRIALEHLLTSQKIKRFEYSQGRRRLLNLHRRIQLLPNKYSHVKELFFAVKWLGNAGSHSGKKIVTEDVMDAYELMEEILSEVITNKTKKTKALAKKINKKKGPK